MKAEVLILGAALVIIASHIFNIIARKTNIPSVLMLMALGYGLSFASPFEEAGLRGYLEVLGTIGVILIVLEAALDLHLDKKKWPIIWRSLVLSGGLLLLTSFIIAGGLYLILSMNFLQAMVYAVPLAVMSSAIIIPSVGGLSEHKKEFLTFESAFSDILGIVMFYALKGYFLSAGEDSLILGSIGKVLITAVLSIIITYALIILFQNVTGHVRLFLLLAIILVFYSSGKLLGLSPLILPLLFGLTLNNKKLFFRGNLGYLIHDESFDPIVKDFRVITLESAFVVRTFFFVIFGLASIKLGQLLHWTVPLITIIVLLAIYGTRYGALRLFFKKDIFPDLYIAPRGLITILLFYTIPTEANSVGEILATEQFETGILLLTILITSGIMTYGLIKHAKESASKSGPITPDIIPAEEQESAPNKEQLIE